MIRQLHVAGLATRRLAAHRKPVVDARVAEASQALRAAFVRRDRREVFRQYDILCALRGGRPPRMTVQERAKLFEKVARLVAQAKAAGPLSAEDRALESVLSEMTIGATGTAVQGTIYRQATAMSACGMPTTELLGNGITEATKYDDSLGLAQVLSASFNGLVPTSSPAACAQVAGTVVQCLEYKYDQFSNLAQQRKYYYPIVTGTPSTLPATATEVYQYDDLQRLLAESRSYTNVTPTGALSESYSYEDTGNILSKSDFGGPYVYGSSTRPSANNAGPHAVVSVGAPAGWSYKYDMNGNMLSDGQRNVTYDDEDRPEQITMNGVTTIFRYTPDGKITTFKETAR